MTASARHLDPAHEAFASGYERGIRDGTQWAVQSLGDLRAEADRLAKAAVLLVARVEHELAGAQGRWAENARIDQGWEPSDQFLRGLAIAEGRPEPSSKDALPAKPRRRAKVATTMPTLMVDPALGPSDTESSLTDVRQMKRAAGRAWRA